jgi:RNA polymerase sigma-70 factor (ECF subfamily)
MADVHEILARLESDSPAEVVAAAAELDALFAAQREKVVRVCMKSVGDRAQAEELAQEAMTVAYGKLSTFRGDAAFSSWLCGIARNLSWRASARRKDLLLTDGVLEVNDGASGVVTGLLRDERERLIERAVAGLSPEEQDAVRLRYVEGLSQEEITERLGLSASTGARGLLQRCRRKLARQLRAELAAMGHGTSFIRVL